MSAPSLASGSRTVLHAMIKTGAGLCTDSSQNLLQHLLTPDCHYGVPGREQSSSLLRRAPESGGLRAAPATMLAPSGISSNCTIS